MLIQVLYVPGCPNHEPAVESLKTVLRSEAIKASIQEIGATDEVMPRSLTFPGSPTVRINGQDIKSSAQQYYGLFCRLYTDRTGVPPLDLLQRAMAGAQKEKS